MQDLSEYKHIHCVGIGGIGLSAIAKILLSRGFWVSGSDLKPGEITEKLKNQGALIFTDHGESNVQGADLVVYSSAVSQDNPELVAARRNGIPIATRAEVLGQLMKEFNHSIAVAGTHGKTTTTSMIALILENAGYDPTILTGGNLSAFNDNVKVGKGDFIVTEACEYMDSFLSLHPKYKIILNIDSDHLDYFKDIDHIVSSFERFARLEPDDGVVIAYTANPFVLSIVKNLSCRVITFGLDEQSDYYAKNIQFNSLGMPSFDLFYKGEKLGFLQLAVPGEHNIINALAAAACSRDLGVDTKHIISTLENYTGTQRRFDIIGVSKNGIRVVDDYAHHPTEIKATLAASKNVPHKNLWCLFQPHTYTRTLALFDEFANAFQLADKVILAEIYAAREKNIYKISSKELLAEIKRTHPEKEVYYFESFDEIANFVLNNGESGDLVITMGAGDIYKVAEIILSKS
ncbi:MAG: UDP-N-acetylmuramate--L-alanine ligase [Bacillota bacterium]|jgi:UDP-N-acetylmuramate--alanine ligase|nr:UDP-N-acetylmuramate--L-alanine ligase [Bacillota bacterium]NLM09028.1 UDP-N-acetylmuramate--L-alanine ligase [Clostridiales Family XIII bacterium]